jgi:hypothetical protein
MMEMNVTGSGLVLWYYSSILLEPLHDKLVRMLSPGSALEARPSRYEAEQNIQLACSTGLVLIRSLMSLGKVICGLLKYS